VSKPSYIIRTIQEKNTQKEINGQCHRKQVIDEYITKMLVTPSSKPSSNRLTSIMLLLYPMAMAYDRETSRT